MKLNFHQILWGLGSIVSVILTIAQRNNLPEKLFQNLKKALLLGAALVALGILLNLVLYGKTEQKDILDLLMLNTDNYMSVVMTAMGELLLINVLTIYSIFLTKKRKNNHDV